MRSLHYQLPPISTRICQQCKKVFGVRQGAPKYCSLDCGDAAHRLRQLAKHAPSAVGLRRIQINQRYRDLDAKAEAASRLTWAMIDTRFPGVFTQIERVP